MNPEIKKVEIHLPFSPWKCNHGWDEEKEAKPCPACNGFCMSCGEKIFPLDPETGFCLICEDVFEADYQFYKETNEPHEFMGQLDFIHQES